VSEHRNEPGPMGTTSEDRFDEEQHVGGPEQGMDAAGTGQADDGTGAGLGTRREYRESLKHSRGGHR
jgi:hypothetical protein